MEPIILINMVDEKADVPAQLIPIFGLAVLSVPHHDNRNNKEMSAEDKEKVTRTTWDVVAFVGSGKTSLRSFKTKKEAMSEYNSIEAAIGARQRDYDIEITDERREADAETNRVDEDGGPPRASCYPEGDKATDGAGI